MPVQLHLYSALPHGSFALRGKVHLCRYRAALYIGRRTFNSEYLVRNSRYRSTHLLPCLSSWRLCLSLHGNSREDACICMLWAKIVNTNPRIRIPDRFHTFQTSVCLQTSFSNQHLSSQRRTYCTSPSMAAALGDRRKVWRVSFCLHTNALMSKLLSLFYLTDLFLNVSRIARNTPNIFRKKLISVRTLTHGAIPLFT